MSASLASRRLTGPGFALIALALGVVAAIIVFMTINARGQWSFILPFRGAKILSMALVGYAIAFSTVLFQTITGNRILTPSIMGFDALYLLIQTAIVFFLGSSWLTAIDPRLKFLIEAGVMVLFASLLYRWLFSGAARSLHLIVLVGIVFGLLFRSLSNFMQRLIDPNEFAVLQDRFFATFNTVNSDLLALAMLIVVGVSLIAWRMNPLFDVLTLGREAAIGLGVAYQRSVMTILVLVAILVAVSTALVGPVTFFGLLVANLAYQLLGTHRHKFILPGAGLLAVLCLVGGQLILERVFGLNTSLSIIIEFVGGIVFITLLMRGATR